VGKRTEAALEYEQTSQLADTSQWRTGAHAIALALRGQTEQARSLAREQEAHRGSEFVWPSDIADIYDAMDDKNATLAWLERGYQEHDPEMRSLAVLNPNLNGDPRFEELLKRLNLPR
jgi:hypothetical protein